MLKALGYGWRVLVNLFNIAVVLIVFASAYERDLTITLGVLGIIYVTMRTMGIGQFMYLSSTFVLIGKELSSLKVRLDGEDDSFQREDFAEAERILGTRNVKFWIDICGMAIISLICLFQIFTSL